MGRGSDGRFTKQADAGGDQGQVGKAVKKAKVQGNPAADDRAGTGKRNDGGVRAAAVEREAKTAAEIAYENSPWGPLGQPKKGWEGYHDHANERARAAGFNPTTGLKTHAGKPQQEAKPPPPNKAGYVQEYPSGVVGRVHRETLTGWCDLDEIKREMQREEVLSGWGELPKR